MTSKASEHPTTLTTPSDLEIVITRDVDAPRSLRDVVAGRPTEVEHVFGDLVTRARALSVDTPLLDLTTLHLRVPQHRIGKRALEELQVR